MNSMSQLMLNSGQWSCWAAEYHVNIEVANTNVSLLPISVPDSSARPGVAGVDGGCGEGGAVKWWWWWCRGGKSW